MHLSAKWEPKYKDGTKQAVKKIILFAKPAVGKGAWVKACKRSKVKLPYHWV